MDVNDRIHKIVQAMDRMMDVQASSDAEQMETNDRLSEAIRKLTICVAVLGTMVVLLAIRVVTL